MRRHPITHTCFQYVCPKTIKLQPQQGIELRLDAVSIVNADGDVASPLLPPFHNCFGVLNKVKAFFITLII
mgnify:CR=1 FL=1|jgi:hypothetical protein